MTHRFRHIPRVLLGVGLVVLVFGAAGAAAATKAAKAKPPCWKTLINDWYDGRIDGTYPIHCYRDALKHLPTDVETYSSARDDIQQALQERITQSSGGGPSSSSGSGGTSGGTGTSGGSGSSGSGSSGSGSTGGKAGSGGGKTGSGGGTSGGSPKGPSKTASGPIKEVFDATKPATADSVPVPLIVLGAVALLLMAAGGAGFLARRMRMRKLQLASAATVHGGPSDEQRAEQ